MQPCSAPTFLVSEAVSLLARQQPISHLSHLHSPIRAPLATLRHSDSGDTPSLSSSHASPSPLLLPRFLEGGLARYKEHRLWCLQLWVQGLASQLFCDLEWVT